MKCRVSTRLSLNAGLRVVVAGDFPSGAKCSRQDSTAALSTSRFCNVASLNLVENDFDRVHLSSENQPPRVTSCMARRLAHERAQTHDQMPSIDFLIQLFLFAASTSSDL